MTIDKVVEPVEDNLPLDDSGEPIVKDPATPDEDPPLEDPKPPELPHQWMSSLTAEGGLLQPHFALDKPAGAGLVGTMEVDYVKIWEAR